MPNPLLEDDNAPSGGLLAALRIPEFKAGLMALLSDPSKAAQLGLVQGAVSGATLPGDVYQGKVDPLSDEGIQRATDLAGLAMTGGVAGAKMAPGETALGAGPIRAYHGSPHDFRQVRPVEDRHGRGRAGLRAWAVLRGERPVARSTAMISRRR
jgi:hypothetical protein